MRYVMIPMVLVGLFVSSAKADDKNCEKCIEEYSQRSAIALQELLACIRQQPTPARESVAVAEPEPEVVRERVVERVVEKPVEKIIRERVEVPVYRDRVVEKEVRVEVPVYRDRIVEREVHVAQAQPVYQPTYQVQQLAAKYEIPIQVQPVQVQPVQVPVQTYAQPTCGYDAPLQSYTVPQYATQPIQQYSVAPVYRQSVSAATVVRRAWPIARWLLHCDH